ncbi:competence/damage-inducible protein A [Halococcoides cellulosivorans]|uniref:Competence/damage-inducible protein A n=1 Tax=Halococcoides cellulosivorans TaxID=1679096 RepID=A0A2R4WXY1_9EURY|nr:molybdopterin-binding protein [Halococcoides cellulosivorans]AWB26371.1 competence/damage-inducible protein A [Halococcoides cellulosivorans]
MEVGIVTVGDELLVGDTVNGNAAWLGQQLHERGADPRRITVVGDSIGAIADAVDRHRDAFDAVIATGGLGPTHDDRTMAAIAALFDRPLEPHPDAIAYLEAERGYSNEELAADTVALPAGARHLPNSEGVAPGAVVETVYVLPGVPAEMKAMFEAVAGEFGGTRPVIEVVRVPGHESELLDVIEGVRERFDVQVGSYPGEVVRIKLTGTEDSEVAAAADWVREHADVEK